MTYSPLQSQHSADRHNVVSAVSQFLFSIPLNSPLSPTTTDIFLSVADYVPDEKLAEVVEYTFKDTLPFPSTPRWLPIIMDLLAKLNRPAMPLCRRALARCIRKLYDSVRDLSEYRDPLVRIALQAWERSMGAEDDHETVRDILAVLEDGIVDGAADLPFTQGIYVRPPQAFSATGLDQRIQALLVAVASGCDCVEEPNCVPFGSTLDQSSFAPVSLHGPSLVDPDRMRSPNNSTIESPVISPHPSGLSTPSKSTAPVGYSSSNNLTSPDDHNHSLLPRIGPVDSPDPFLDHETRCKSMNAVITLIRTFSRLAFSPPHSLDSDSPFKAARAPASSKCITVFENLLSLLGPTTATTDLPEGEERPLGHKQARCRRARLAILQWTVRLRADRDHRLYVLDNVDMAVDPFAALVKRGFASSENPDVPGQTLGHEVERESRRQRLGAQRGGTDVDPREPSETPSRSKSRLPTSPRESFSSRSPLDPLWGLPDVLPFEVPDDSRPSEGMTTYSADLTEHDGITQSLWLSVSMYVCILTDILHDETDWEILSYTLCHLPLQLSNKHLFCGPRTRKTVGNLVSVLCSAIFNDRLGSKAQIPADLKSTDIHGLAYQTLTILIGYRDSFDSRERILSESLVQAFCQGLNRYHTVAKPCLQALSICSYELQSPMAKFLPQILNQLAQVISNPAISRQILELLAIIGTIPILYSNLREAEFNLIFTAAGRYIQRHNQPAQISMSTSGGAQVGGESFALSQHVLVLAYYVIYIWFLGIKRPERPRYIRSIARHLLIANDGNAIMTEMTEVCFDWLARYTYSNGSPRSSSVTQPSFDQSSKTWLMGNSLLTVENLPRPGWISITSRRPSGIVHVTSRIDDVTAERLDGIDLQELISNTIADTPIRPTNDLAPPGPEFASEEALVGCSFSDIIFH
jgi:tuberous sclerosis 2